MFARNLGLLILLKFPNDKPIMRDTKTLQIGNTLKCLLFTTKFFEILLAVSLFNLFYCAARVLYFDSFFMATTWSALVTVYEAAYESQNKR